MSQERPLDRSAGKATDSDADRTDPAGKGWQVETHDTDQIFMAQGRLNTDAPVARLLGKLQNGLEHGKQLVIVCTHNADPLRWMLNYLKHVDEDRFSTPEPPADMTERTEYDFITVLNELPTPEQAKLTCLPPQGVKTGVNRNQLVYMLLEERKQRDQFGKCKVGEMDFRNSTLTEGECFWIF